MTLHTPEQTPTEPPELPKPDPRLRRAERTIRFGVYAGILYALLATASTLILQFVEVPPRFADYADPWRFIGLPFLLIAVYFLYRKSRIAAIALFLWATFNLLVGTFVLRYDWLVIPIFLFFMILFGRATVATFRYHQLIGAQIPKTWKNYITYAGISATVVIIVAIMILGLLVETAVLPPTGFLDDEDIPPRYTTILREHDILEPGETLLMFYSAGLFSILEDGNVLTNQRVISYWQEDGELLIYSIPIDEIEDTIVVMEGDFWTDTEVHVFGPEQQNWTVLYLSTENGGDKRFLERLNKMRVGFRNTN